jgi:LacI family transcriptional regulator
MKKVTVKDIAEELNVSISTVSKALSGKSGVSEEMRSNILKTAKKLGYHVNRVAQGLSRKTIKIGVIMPKVWNEFYGAFKKGIEIYLKDMVDFNIEARYKYVSNLYTCDEYIEAINYFLKENMNGIILCPSYNNSYCKYVDSLNENNIPVVILGSDLPCGKRLCCVREDSILAGKMAAEVMKWIIPKNKKIAVFIGNKDMSDHSEKVNGFMNEYARLDEVIGVYETQDDPDVAYHITNKLIFDRPELGGIYVATGNSLSVCKCIEENNMNDNVNIIATDIFLELEKYVIDNIVKGIIFQDPILQGELAIKTLYKYLVFKDYCEPNILIRPQLILKNNFSLYLD